MRWWKYFFIAAACRGIGILAGHSFMSGPGGWVVLIIMLLSVSVLLQRDIRLEIKEHKQHKRAKANEETR